MGILRGPGWTKSSRRLRDTVCCHPACASRRCPKPPSPWVLENGSRGPATWLDKQITRGQRHVLRQEAGWGGHPRLLLQLCPPWSAQSRRICSPAPTIWPPHRLRLFITFLVTTGEMLSHGFGPEMSCSPGHGHPLLWVSPPTPSMPSALRSASPFQGLLGSWFTGGPGGEGGGRRGHCSEVLGYVPPQLPGQRAVNLPRPELP